MERLIKNCRTVQISAMITWLTVLVLYLFAENVLSLVVLWVSGTLMWTLSIVLLYLERAVVQNAARQLEALQMTYHATRQACENADYEQMDKLKETLGIHSSSEEAAKHKKEAASNHEDARRLRTVCCGYADVSAIRFNPYNNVIQCHNCGRVYMEAKGET